MGIWRVVVWVSVSTCHFGTQLHANCPHWHRKLIEFCVTHKSRAVSTLRRTNSQGVFPTFLTESTAGIHADTGNLPENDWRCEKRDWWAFGHEESPRMPWTCGCKSHVDVTHRWLFPWNGRAFVWHKENIYQMGYKHSLLIQIWAKKFKKKPE